MITTRERDGENFTAEEAHPHAEIVILEHIEESFVEELALRQARAINDEEQVTMDPTLRMAGSRRVSGQS